MHPIFAARKTVHLYTPAPVDEGAVERALQAAQLAPCHKYTWPWRFVRAGMATRERIHALAGALKFPDGVPDRVKPKLMQKFVNPQLFAVAQVIDDDPFRRREDYAAVACAIQNFCLSLGSEGIGSKWSTGGVTRAPETYELFRIDPAEQEIVGFVVFGHALEDKPRPERPPVADVVRVLR